MIILKFFESTKTDGTLTFTVDWRAGKGLQSSSLC